MNTLKGIAKINNESIKALDLKNNGSSNIVVLRKNLRTLWDDFTSLIFEEVSINKIVTLQAEKSGKKIKMT